MTITLWNYGVLPTLIYVPFLFLIVFLATIKLKTQKKQRFFIVSTLTGFLGFSMTFALPFYEPLRFAYTLVPTTFFVLSFLGIVGCLWLNVNPFDVKTPLFALKPKKKRLTPIQTEMEEGEKPFTQSIEESTKLLDLLLFKLGKPYHSFKGIQLSTTGEEGIEFPFIVTSPHGLFLIYPCNWSGEILFSDNGARKTLSTPLDVEDFSITAVFHEVFFKQLLDTIGLRETPVKTIVCATNPSAVVKGETTKFIATELGELASILKRTPPNGITISTANLFDIQNAIELNQMKK